MSYEAKTMATFEQARWHIIENTDIVSESKEFISVTMLRFNRRLTRSLARANKWENWIEIGRALADLPQSEEIVFQIALHEFCHLLVKDRGHGMEFKAMCAQVGCEMSGHSTKGFQVAGIRTAERESAALADGRGLPKDFFPPTSRRTEACWCPGCKRPCWVTLALWTRIKLYGGRCNRCRQSVTVLTPEEMEQKRKEYKK